MRTFLALMTSRFLVVGIRAAAGFGRRVVSLDPRLGIYRPAFSFEIGPERGRSLRGGRDSRSRGLGLCFGRGQQALVNLIVLVGVDALRVNCGIVEDLALDVAQCRAEFCVVVATSPVAHTVAHTVCGSGDV